MKIKVSDFIGEKYKEWKSGNTVIMDAYTGSGKTHFVRKKLLPHAIRNGKKIVYFCNRKSLKDQLKELQKNTKIEIDGQIYNAMDYFYIVSYQYCETIGKFHDFTISLKKLNPDDKLYYKNKKENISINQSEIMYYVFDEAHYFIMDSSFNRKNAFWFEQNFQFKDSISLFLTATPEPFYLFYYFNKKRVLLDEYLHNFISASYLRKGYQKQIDLLVGDIFNYNREKSICDFKSKIDEISKDKLYENLICEIDNILQMFRPQKYLDSNFLLEGENPVNVYSYLLEKEYSQYTCYYFEEYDSIINKIISSTDKWLIFVNSEEDGKKLEAELNIKNSSFNSAFFFPVNPYAVFLSSKTKKSGASTVYNDIVSKEKFDCKVLIATSVIDCGVNIKDETLNNIVIAQPDKTEFLQMLGRLRETENQEINLYIKNISDDTKRCLITDAKTQIGHAIDYKDFENRNKNNNNIHSEIEKESKKQKFINYIIKSELSNIFTFSKKRKQFFDGKNPIIDIMDDLKINSSYLIYNFYKIWQYCKRSEEYTNNNATKESHLFKQLEWISKKYLPYCWVNYEETMEEIIKIIKFFKTIEYLDSTGYKKFKEEIFNKILNLPLMLLPDQIVKDISTYKKGRIPQLSTINSTLAFLGFNYKIKDKRSNGKKKWYVDYIEKTEV